MPAPVLICYDGSEDAGRAIDVAATLLASTTAVVLDVAPTMTGAEHVAAIASPVSGPAAFHDSNQADALERAGRGAERARHAGFRAKARGLVAPSRWEGIVAVADEVEAAVIVLGSRSLSGLGELARGSVSHQVAEHARRPVLLVPRPRRAAATPAGSGPVLLCYDGSPEAVDAIEAAAVLLRQRHAVVLDAIPSTVSVGYSRDPSEAEFVDVRGGEAGLGRAETGAELARRHGFEAAPRIESEPATWRAVTKVADELDASVIVTGSRSLTGFREVAERSVSHDVATHAHRPVLVVPRPRRS